MISLKNRKVASVRFHAGVAVGLKVLNSATPGKDTVVSLELVEGGGIYVASKSAGKSFEDIVPSGNILSIRLAEHVEDAPEEPKSSKK